VFLAALEPMKKPLLEHRWMNVLLLLDYGIAAFVVAWVRCWTRRFLRTRGRPMEKVSSRQRLHPQEKHGGCNERVPYEKFSGTRKNCVTLV
jgi:hypothetical protein